MTKRNFPATARWVILTVLILATGLAMTSQGAQIDPPELAAWLINKTGATGFNGQLANVQSVQYSENSVYVRSTGIPTYAIGPWSRNPNTARAQNYLFRIPRKPSESANNKIVTPIGPIGFLTNGVPFYNMSDARSFNNQNIWHQNALFFEGDTFDSCWGHPQQQGAYHHHVNPRCLYEDKPSEHSPLLGFALDGFPIYGPRGCANADGTGGVKLLQSSYRLRQITLRQTLPDGTPLSSNQFGPDVSTRFPLGAYMEDFEFLKNLGDLDQYNGRFAVTPEYPNGTYAYFITIDEKGTPVYPYLIGPQYFGISTVLPRGPGAPPPIINEPVQTFQGASGVANTDRDCQ
jgi:hypothetical protein